jgi:glc operon protein GlcG
MRPYCAAISAISPSSKLSVPKLHGMLEGGVAIWHEGRCIGAIGVSGVKAEQGAELARLAVDSMLRSEVDTTGVQT